MSGSEILLQFGKKKKRFVEREVEKLQVYVVVFIGRMHRKRERLQVSVTRRTRKWVRIGQRL